MGGGHCCIMAIVRALGHNTHKVQGGRGSKTHAYTVAPLAVVGAGRQGRWGEGRGGGGGVKK